MNNNLELVIYSPDAGQCDSLRPLFADSDIAVFQGAGPEVTAACQLDAIFLTGMHLSYWGLDPFLRNHAEVAISPEEKVAMGLPKLFVAAWVKADGNAASYGIRYAELMLHAVETHNEAHALQRIARLGTIPDFLDLNGKYAVKNAEALKHLLRGSAHREHNHAHEDSRARVA